MGNLTHNRKKKKIKKSRRKKKNQRCQLPVSVRLSKPSGL
jgi:hypothetical protein